MNVRIFMAVVSFFFSNCDIYQMGSIILKGSRIDERVLGDTKSAECRAEMMI